MWDSSRGVAVGQSGKILRTTNGGSIVVGVRQGEHEIPMTALLKQNYPNPFNPTTTIQYQIPRQIDGGQATAGRVVLKIYNLLGQEVATLVDEIQEPGFRSVVWNAGDVASGVYFYRLQTSSFVQTRKMLLLR
jgi:hypothetical protein